MSKLTLGIVGGGQLAYMLAESALRAGHSVFVLAQPHEPCSRLNHKNFHFVAGQSSQPNELADFVNTVSHLTIESEFVDADILEQALRSANKRVVIHPLPKTIKLLQNKLSQKELFQRQHLPTAKFHELKTDTVESQLNELLERYPNGLMLKWANGGYDGKGNFVFKDKIKIEQALQFCSTAFDRKSRVYAEELIPFDLELAMIYLRSPSGKFTNYPLVISQQTNSICKLVKGPATKLGVPNEIESKAIQMGYSLGEAAQITGVFAVEYFYSQKSGLLINEMAPRVHNSGHYTLCASDKSQFDLHVQMVMTGEWISPTQRPFFAMLNILGPVGLEKMISPDFSPPPTLNENLFPYWYKKTEVKPWRKMGHIGLRANSLHELEMGVQLMQEYEQKLWKELD